jgi:hypothetical protein
MRSSITTFVIGFALTLLLFLAANLLAAHLQSDCGLPGLFKTSGCADDISRAGFPLLFYEEGGFMYRSRFEIATLALDVLCGLGLAALGGVVTRHLWRVR